jgi:metal-responsive CopG/Arc/MetJ family transcriptional regulator
MTPVRVSVSFPKSILETVDARAARYGMTRSGFLATAALSYSPNT